MNIQIEVINKMDDTPFEDLSIRFDDEVGNSIFYQCGWEEISRDTFDTGQYEILIDSRCGIIMSFDAHENSKGDRYDGFLVDFEVLGTEIDTIQSRLPLMEPGNDFEFLVNFTPFEKVIFRKSMDFPMLNELKIDDQLISDSMIQASNFPFPISAYDGNLIVRKNYDDGSEFIDTIGYDYFDLRDLVIEY